LSSKSHVRHVATSRPPTVSTAFSCAAAYLFARQGAQTQLSAAGSASGPRKCREWARGQKGMTAGGSAAEKGPRQMAQSGPAPGAGHLSSGTSARAHGRAAAAAPPARRTTLCAPRASTRKKSACAWKLPSAARKQGPHHGPRHASQRSSAVVSACMQRKNSASGGSMKVVPRQAADRGGGALQFVVPQLAMKQQTSAQAGSVQ